jgi:hypothetical protein
MDWESDSFEERRLFNPDRSEWIDFATPSPQKESRRQMPLPRISNRRLVALYGKHGEEVANGII